MFKKFSTEAAIVTAGVITAVTSVYNSEKVIQAASKETENKVTALENKVDAISSKMDTILDIASKQSTNTGSSNIPNLYDVKEAAMFDLSILGPDYLFSVSFILFSLATLSVTVGLIINLYVTKNKNKFLDKVPSFLVPVIKLYLKVIPYSNTYYFVLIITSQVFILLLSVYLKFRGIA